MEKNEELAKRKVSLIEEFAERRVLLASMYYSKNDF